MAKADKSRSGKYAGYNRGVKSGYITPSRKRRKSTIDWNAPSIPGYPF